MPVLIAALGPRLLRVAGHYAAGTIPWMADARAIETHIAPVIRTAAEAAGKPEPRIVAGLPVAVHDDEAEARSVAGAQFAAYGDLPNYQRILTHGRVSGPAEAALVGDEASVTNQIEGLFSGCHRRVDGTLPGRRRQCRFESPNACVAERIGTKLARLGWKPGASG